MDSYWIAQGNNYVDAASSSTVTPGSGPNAGPVWKAGTTRIMAMGDSLTLGQGGESQGGYRNPLWNALTADGKTLLPVGYRPGPGGTNGQPFYNSRWSGYGGWRIEELLGTGSRNMTGLNAYDWLRLYTPDTILLHIGTNNMYAGINLNWLIGQYQLLLDTMYAIAPNTHIFIAEILQHQAPWGTIDSYNLLVRAMVNNYISQGRPYHLVQGMNTIVGAANYSDAIHLSAAGYQAMATIWKTAIDAAGA